VLCVSAPESVILRRSAAALGACGTVIECGLVAR